MKTGVEGELLPLFWQSYEPALLNNRTESRTGKNSGSGQRPEPAESQEDCTINLTSQRD